MRAHRYGLQQTPRFAVIVRRDDWRVHVVPLEQKAMELAKGAIFVCEEDADLTKLLMFEPYIGNWQSNPRRRRGDGAAEDL